MKQNENAEHIKVFSISEVASRLHSPARLPNIIVSYEFLPAIVTFSNIERTELLQNFFFEISQVID